MFSRSLLRLCFWLGVLAASAAVAQTLRPASPGADAVLDAGAYVLVGALLVFLLKPHPCGSSRAILAEHRIANCDASAVDYKAIVCRQTPATHKRYVVFGAGFVGRKLIHALLMRGETSVRVFDADPASCDAFKNDARVDFVHGDVTRYEAVLAAVQGAEHVFATFAIIRFMDRLAHQAPLSFRVNVQGTENVVRACQAAGVAMLVQTSTSNVSVCAQRASLDMDEKSPYVCRDEAPNHYAWTKAVAEQIVLAADGAAGMRTAAVRPCSAVFGADDRHVLDPMLKLGRTLLPPNGGAGVMDFVAVNNVVWAHLLLERKLIDEPDSVGGEAFCVSNNAPMRMRDFIGIVERLRPGGLATVPTPQMLLVLIAHVVEAAKLAGAPMPRALDALTGCTLDFLDLNYSFSGKKAFERLGYRPLYTVEQGVELAVRESAQGRMLPALG